ARLPAVGEPAGEGQDDRAALPGIRPGPAAGGDARRGSEGKGHCRRSGRRARPDRTAGDGSALPGHRTCRWRRLAACPARRPQRLRLRLRRRGGAGRGRGRASARGAGAGRARRRRRAQAARRRRRGAPDPGRGTPAARTGRAPRPVRDEHPPGADAGLRRLPGRPLLTRVPPLPEWKPGIARLLRLRPVLQRIGDPASIASPPRRGKMKRLLIRMTCLLVLPVLLAGCGSQPDLRERNRELAMQEIGRRELSFDLQGLQQATRRAHDDGAYLFEEAGFFRDIDDAAFKALLLHLAQTRNHGLRAVLERHPRQARYPAADLQQALDHAVRDGVTATVSLLLGYGARPGDGTLLHAAYRDDAALARMLVDAGASFAQGEDAEAIGMAARLGNLQALKGFVESGKA